MGKRKTFEIAWNAAIVVTILGAVIWYFIPGNVDVIGSTRLRSFRYFTTDSNLLIALAATIRIIFLLKARHDELLKLPVWFRRLHYAATVAGAVTFFEVLLFMSPVAMYLGGVKAALGCYRGNVFILHFLAPLMMMLSFVITDKEYHPTRKETIISMLPMMMYGSVYFVMVVVLKAWPDFYKFTFNGRYEMVPIVIIVMFLGTYAISTLLKKLKATE